MTEKEMNRLTKLKEIDNKIFEQGLNYICGIDEAGRGPLKFLKKRGRESTKK